MPIDPTKMDAFLNEGSPPMEGDEGMPGEGGEITEPVEPGTDEHRFDALMPLLEMFAEDISDVADDMDQDLLLDTEEPMTPEAYEIITDSIAGLDKRLQKQMKAALTGGISPEEADTLAQHLADEELTEEPEVIAGWLFRAAESYQGPPAEEDEDEDLEDDEDGEDLEDEEGADEDLPEPEDLLNEV